MYASDSSAEFWLDVAQKMNVQEDLSSRSWQGETVRSGKVMEDPICLFGQFVSAVTSDILKDIQPQSEFSTFVGNLYAKAPPIAQYLVQEILKHSVDDSQPEVQGFKEHRPGIDHKKPSRKRKQLDLTYRLPKASRALVDIHRVGAKDSHRTSGGSSIVSDDFVTCQPSRDDVTINQSSDSLKKPLLEYHEDIPEFVAKEVPQEGVQGQSSVHGPSMLSCDSMSVLYQLKATYSSDSTRMNPVHKQPLVSLNKSAENREITVCRPLPSMAEQQETALPEINQPQFS